MPAWLRRAVPALIAVALIGCCPLTDEGPDAATPTKAAAPATPGKAAAPAKALTPTTVPVGEWFSLFDGKTLKGWEVLKEDDFSLAGKVQVKDSAILLGEGVPFTGIVWDDEFPKENYEIVWEARRVGGIDIFASVTIPVGDAHVTFVSGGWGDSVVGLSSVDDLNASDNEWTKIMSFKNEQWYDFRIRVTPKKIEAWIDDKPVVECERGDHKFTVYPELALTRPLGFFSWSTTGAVRNLDMRRIKPVKEM